MRILSHNTYWFQGHPFKGDQPPAPNPQVLSSLASLYKSLNPALICLQEIQSQHAADLLSQHLTTPSLYTPGRQLPQYGTCSLSPHATLLSDSSSSIPAPQRAWQVLLLNFPTPLLIANIHLPSARQLPGTQAAAQRIIELQSLLTLHPDSHILLGDFNESSPGGAPGPVSDFLTAQGFLDTATLLKPQNSAPTTTSVKNRRGDQIWLKSTLAPRLTNYGVTPEQTMRVLFDGFGGITHLSDHFPLWIDLDTNP